MKKSKGKIVSLTRGFVIRSIREEAHLMSGNGFFGSTLGVAKKDCTACAVGAVMRRTLSPRTSAMSIEKASYEAAEGDLFESGSCFVYDDGAGIDHIYAKASGEAYTSPMNALSFVFESLSRLSDFLSVEEVREKTIQFVREYFPARIRVNINGYKPAADVKVLK